MGDPNLKQSLYPRDSTRVSRSSLVDGTQRYNGGIILYLCKAVNYIQETFLRLNIANGKTIIPTVIELDVGYKEVHVPGILIWMTVMCAISTPTSPKG